MDERGRDRIAAGRRLTAALGDRTKRPSIKGRSYLVCSPQDSLGQIVDQMRLNDADYAVFIQNNELLFLQIGFSVTDTPIPTPNLTDNPRVPEPDDERTVGEGVNEERTEPIEPRQNEAPGTRER